MAIDKATSKQIDAANPLVSTWLSANAGSGKTRVLTNRVARLLLDQVSPQNILCLTYTKAAANQMQNQLFRRLGQWAMKSDGDLREELRLLGVEKDLTPDSLSRARTLFARALETPGGLKIQTIHSFCATLLRRFPLEAGVSPFFREIDDRQSKSLLRDVLDALAAGPECDKVQALAQHYTDDSFESLAAELLRHRDRFSDPFTHASIWAQFGLHPGFDETELVSSVFLGDEDTLLKTLIAAMAEGGERDKTAAAKLSHVDAVNPNIDDVSRLIDVLLTGASKYPYSAKIGTLPTKSVAATIPDILPQLHALMERVQDARPRYVGLLGAQKTLVLRQFAEPFLAAVEQAKTQRGWLDFDDLILRAKRLLTDPVVAQWVLFRLDGGIDHILVDEAQDTSPDQWAVIELLAREFTTGLGARTDTQRTIFVVGDKKQSIYSFQGAKPQAFDDMAQLFGDRLQSVDQQLNTLSLDHSFRSSSAILAAVDATFSAADQAGLGGKSYHLAFWNDLPGRVDVWPLVPTEPEEQAREWFDPTDKPTARDHRILLAKKIAAELSRLVKSGSIPDDSGNFRRISAGDILILVQRRSLLFHEIIRACKAFDLPIAGADRLRIGGELAVKDIVALLSFLANPDDDLSLAAALRSPLFGLTEAQLFDLAHARHEPRLWPALMRRKGDFPEIFEMLFSLRNQADFLSPYDLMERVLTHHGGRTRLVARLGTEAEDGIDALTAQVLQYEQTNVPSLTGFVTWLETEDIEIKRQTDSVTNQIRVMTTHGAKGLEAPIVVLPDTSEPRMRLNSQILTPDGGAPVWKSAKDRQAQIETEAIEANRQAQIEERMRLMYVAMTRAEKWLIVCGSGEPSKSGASWYDYIRQGLIAANAQTVPFNDETILRLQHGEWQSPSTDEAAQPENAGDGLPEWATSAAPPPKKTKRLISPSELGGEKIVGGLSSDDGLDISGKTRGNILHKLLELLPRNPNNTWPRICSHLCQTFPGLPENFDPTDILSEASRLLTNPNLAHLFAEPSLSEVDIIADMPGRSGEKIYGSIDLLVFRPDMIWCVDFKSNAVVPDKPELVPSGILRQLGAYASALRQIYPERTIQPAILWTKNATLMPVSHDIVSKALSSVTTS